jgi:molecular chaperone GrpE
MNDDIKKQTEEQNEEITEKDAENEQVVALEEKVTDLDNKYKRALADYQNLEKRVREERSEWIKSANQQLLLRLLPALDTVMLASQHTEDKGIKATVDHFLSTLQSEGIEKIETKDKEFDPSTMEVIQTMDGKDGKVLQEVRAGYILYGKLLRPAQVVVGQVKTEENSN